MSISPTLWSLVVLISVVTGVVFTLPRALVSGLVAGRRARPRRRRA